MSNRRHNGNTRDYLSASPWRLAIGFSGSTGRTLLGAALLVILGIFASQACAAPKQDLKQLRQRIEALQKDLESSEESMNEAADALKESERAISTINRKLHELDLQKHDTEATLAQVKSKTSRAQETIRAQQEQLGKLLYQQYLSGEQDYLATLLNQKDPNQASRDLHYFSYISRARASLIGTLRSNLAELHALDAEARQKNDELERIRSEQVDEKRSLEKEQKARKDVLAKVSHQVKSQRREIGRLQQDEKRLTRLIERLSKIVTTPRRKPTSGPRNTTLPDASVAGIPFRELKGRLNLPVKGELLNHFGSPREDTGTSWKGLFIRAPEGQIVKAIASGRVVFADWLRGFGNLLIIDHGAGFMSLYGNNESVYKQVGDQVQAGDTVATVGNSGGNPDSGLYFELRYQSKPIDPMAWMTLK